MTARIIKRQAYGEPLVKIGTNQGQRESMQNRGRVVRLPVT